MVNRNQLAEQDKCSVYGIQATFKDVISILQRGSLTAIPPLHTHLRDSHTNEPGVKAYVRENKSKE